MKQTRALAVLLAFVCVARESRSELDQYEVPERESHRQLLPAKATDQPLDVPNVPHRFGLLKKLASYVETPSPVPELQVGCEEGFTDSRNEPLKEIVRKRRDAELEDIVQYRRNYIRFSRNSALRNVNVWQPQTYQISRPYFIPVYGHPAAFTIYYPPQPIVFNPVYPLKNPTDSNLPPKPYLPPKDPIELENRFDKPPVWDDQPPATRPPTNFVPTRRPARPGQKVTHPPLEHNPLPPQQDGQFVNLAAQDEAPVFMENEELGYRSTTTTTESPTVGLNAPSRCTWAIVSCCSSNSANVRYDCFEQFNCSGAFWDDSPCNAENSAAAIASIKHYYASSSVK